MRHRCSQGVDHGVAFAIKLDGDAFGDALFLHGDAVKGAGDRHGALVVRDDDELGVGQEVLNDGGKARGIRFIQGGIDFVQNAEGGGFGFEDRHDQGHGGHGFFAAGEQGHGLRLLAGGAGHDFDTGFKNVVGVFQDEVGLPPAEEAAEHFVEFEPDGREAVGEPLAGILVDLADELLKLPLGIDNVGELALQGRLAFLKLRLLQYRVEVHIPQP